MHALKLVGRTRRNLFRRQTDDVAGVSGPAKVPRLLQ